MVKTVTRKHIFEIFKRQRFINELTIDTVAIIKEEKTDIIKLT